VWELPERQSNYTVYYTVAIFTTNPLKILNKSTGGSSVNPQVAGSSPAWGASVYKGWGRLATFFFAPFRKKLI
jgi:hypothetical protein